MAKHKIDRARFIHWLTRNYLGSILQSEQMVDDLTKGGEYVVTADELLQMQKHIPGYLIKGSTEVSVPAEDCELIYNLIE